MTKVLSSDQADYELAKRGAQVIAAGQVTTYRLTIGGGTARRQQLPDGRVRLELLGCKC